MLDALRRLVDSAYSPADYPALAWQVEQWRASRPFEGARVLDVTPVFGNTVAKYLPLLAGGAELTVSLSPLLPHDPEIAEALIRIGVPVTETGGEFDVVMDCAGVRSSTTATAGYVELTKSGTAAYQHCPRPVYLVDDSQTKLIETSLGTADGFLRAMAHFGHPDLTGRNVVVFGGGKVGGATALKTNAAGARVTVVDPDPATPTPQGCARVSDEDAAREAIAEAWCVVTATGKPAALAPLTQELLDSTAILANLGAEDEFGPDVPPDRALSGKRPVNFALAEPTRLRYLDATMALVNACALELLLNDPGPGLHRPPAHLEDQILDLARATIGDEMQANGL